ncbi:hypothetical protein NW762_014561 [Fusarium torreyae]|uniref:AB hydrolase-1 domain-containing protein n=1 Tax=Fusarium torreyae TaxID=1237075 RepID=A0A9W8V986_9HYPO|nr:hypothetical protein NW762_014561 [Fusarium torreyae]
MRLNPDESFHFELLRNLSHARYKGADVAEVLEAAGQLKGTDMESFYQAFIVLAERVDRQAQAVDAKRHPVSARDAFFRASTYYRAADFYLHGNPDDPRISALWKKQTNAFDRAIALLPVPGRRVLLDAKDGSFQIPVIYLRAENAGPNDKRPTMILGNGFDGAQEEMLHILGFAALERGYNVILYEGPGQPTVRREQNKGFIPEWEKVVSPVVDFLVSLPEVLVSRIALVGYSMGGWLAVRAAAFEHRVAATLAIDGVFDVHQAVHNMMPEEVRAHYDAGDFEKANESMKSMIDSGKAPVALTWLVQQGNWSFKADSITDFMDKTRSFSLKDVVSSVKCPVWVGDAAEDIFFKGQPELVRDALGQLATYQRLTAEDGAANHCHVGATAHLNALVLDWFDDVTTQG